MARLSFPIYRSLMGRDLYAGIALIPLILLLYVTVLFVLAFSMPYFLIVTIFLWLVLKIFTDKDEFLVDIAFSSLFQPDYLD